MRSVHEFVDRDLRRSRGGWEHLSLPEALRVLADQTWQEMTGERSFPELDALRASYTDMYAEAEALAHSSIAAARQSHPTANGRVAPAAAWLIRRVPVAHKRRVPAAWRRRARRSLRR
jgi:hypothetical protein